MSKENPGTVRIELTTEQMQQIREQTGQETSALEFTVEQLEERVAPRVRLL